MTDKKLYRQEMKKLRMRHNQYRPELKKLLDYHLNPYTTDGLIEVTEPDEMLLICELLDIGYLDLNAITVQMENDAVCRVVYNKKYPLTVQGEALLHDDIPGRPALSDLSDRMRIILLIISVAIAITTIIYFIR